MKIIGTGSALPKKVVTNDMLSEFLETSDEWISSRTGIRERRLLSSERLVDLAIDASNKAVEASGLQASDLDFIICSNVANNDVTPGMSCVVEGAIGANCPCIDVNVACAGFLYALDYADSFLTTGRCKNILIVCAEEPTRFCNWKERDISVLFGDGAGAVVVTKGEPLMSRKFTCTSNQNVIRYSRRMEDTPFEEEGVEFTRPLIMSGKEVFRNAVSASQRDLECVLKEAGITAEDVKYFVLHQANLRIIASIQEHMGQPVEKFPTNLQHYGNTSSASIPILLDELVRAGKIERGDILAMSSFGAGFATGAMVFKY